MDQEMWKGTGKRDGSNPSGHSRRALSNGRGSLRETACIQKDASGTQGREGNPVHFHYRRRRQAAIPGKRTVQGTEKELQGLQAICQINKRHVF